jgi:tetrahydrodipicolinate N-succinyltransferase
LEAALPRAQRWMRRPFDTKVRTGEGAAVRRGAALHTQFPHAQVAGAGTVNTAGVVAA